MIRNQNHTRIVICAFLSLAASAVFGQGPLAPPGVPLPTMKTLDQVEPRTAITNLPITISQGGSYYLTQSFVQNFSDHAIRITTNNVTLDLCGFTVQSTSGQTVDGILAKNAALSVPLKNVLVKNGSISGFSPSYGIECLGTRNCVFEDLTITACGDAMIFQANGSARAVGNIIRRCRICDNSSAGISLTSTGNGQNLIQNCEILNSGAIGLGVSSPSNLVVNCRASGNSVNYSIAAGNREGIIVQPGTNTTFSGSSGGVGTGTSDACLNVSY